MPKPTRRRRRRRIAAGVVCLTIGGSAAGLAWRRPPATTTAEAAPILKTTPVKTGDLTTTERIDGTIELSSTLTVLHRIAGQTSTTSTSASKPAPRQSAGTSTSGLSSTLLSSASATEGLVGDCSISQTPATTAETTPQPTTTVVVPDTTPSATVDTAVTTSTPTTDVPATMPATTAPPTTPCATTSTTPSSTPVAPTAAAPTGAGRTRPSASTGASAGPTTPASTVVTQTITSVVAVNTDLHSGDVLYTVDGKPVVALDGNLPAWRSLSTSSADGVDIAQLEAALVALGYDPNSNVTVDNHFDAATRTMVKAWQQGLGIDQTGKVTLGSIVFLPSTTSVTAVEQHVGDSVGEGDAVLQLASPTQDVVIDVPAGDEALVVPGLSVMIGDVQGTVTQLRSADADGSVVVEAVIAPATAIDGATNGSTVKVSLTLQNATGVLLVPADALVSRLDGTYAVQVKATGEAASWLAVEIVGVSGANVAIRADGLTDGTLVLLPV
ncbi:MAG: peptidoglycan-binding protein [Ilumatobacteraceae bacterium]